jgi:hypothetical protein
MTPQRDLQPKPQTAASLGNNLKSTKVTLETIPEKDTQILKIEDSTGKGSNIFTMLCSYCHYAYFCVYLNVL